MSISEKNIKLVIEYKGTIYAGWQIQADQRTIQGEITNAILKTTGQNVNVIGAGRTDAGVHALGQMANFIIDHDLDPVRYRDALNYYLDDEIRIHSSEEVPIEFHARKDAIHKRYRYLVCGQKSALYRDYRWEYEPDLDIELLRKAAQLLIGTHDFTAFCVVNSRKENNECQIYHSQWAKIGPLLVFEIRGNRFLHHMVRSLVGGMVNLATTCRDHHPENLTLEQFADIIHAPKDRRVVFTAPAQGLYLVSVTY
jgi:tRNA pseudouridine38-40 synthase